MSCRPADLNPLTMKSNTVSVSQKIRLTSIYTQVEILSAKLFLSKEATLKFLDERFDQMKLPPSALGLCAIPAPESGNHYMELTLAALDLVSREFDEFSGLECRNTPEKFFVPKNTLKCLEKVQKHQEGQILILPITLDEPVATLGVERTFLFGSLFTACLALTNQDLYHRKTDILREENVVECIGFGKVSCRKCWFDDTKLRWGKIWGLVPNL